MKEDREQRIEHSNAQIMQIMSHAQTLQQQQQQFQLQLLTMFHTTIQQTMARGAVGGGQAMGGGGGGANLAAGGNANVASASAGVMGGSMSVTPMAPMAPMAPFPMAPMAPMPFGSLPTPTNTGPAVPGPPQP